MEDLQFVGISGNRRRRMLGSDPQQPTVEAPVTGTLNSSECSVGNAFPLLSRDRVIRRFVSPKLRKHAFVAALLVLPSLALSMICITDLFRDQALVPSVLLSAESFRGLAGLELFAAAQFCLLICWVRAASAVDFHGGYRTWRSMAAILFGLSLLLLTGAAPALADLLVWAVQPLFGRINFARQTLLLVSVAAVIVAVLWQVVPDMQRCRSSQCLLIVAVVMLPGRFFVGSGRIFSDSSPVLIAVLDLLCASLVLSSMQLHCRYVIHVNPNPPARRKEVKSSAGPVIDVRNPADTVPDTPTAIPMAAAALLRESTESTPAESSAKGEFILVAGSTTKTAHFSDSVAGDSAVPLPDARSDISSKSDSGKSKSVKKQRRRAG